MIIPNNSFDISSMIVQSNMNYLESASNGALPATSAITSTDGAVEPNLMHSKNFYSLQETMMQQNSLQETYEGFGWGDFPLLQQSMVTVVPSEAVFNCARPTANFPSDQSRFGQDRVELSSSSSFDSISPVSSSPSLCSTEESSSSSQEDSSRSQRRVQFAQVQVREYALTLGDHPWCEDGFPLSLDWKFAPQRDVNIDDYEHERLSGADSDRSARKLDVWERRNLLRRVSGYSTSELNGLERIRMLQQQRESLLLSSCGNDESELDSSATSTVLRHSNTLQNLSSASV